MELKKYKLGELITLAAHKASLKEKFEESRKLEEEIMKQLDKIVFDNN